MVAAEEPPAEPARSAALHTPEQVHHTQRRLSVAAVGLHEKVQMILLANAQDSIESITSLPQMAPLGRFNTYRGAI
jgi:hypothetical protein